jgi:hypothetical protein
MHSHDEDDEQNGLCEAPRSTGSVRLSAMVAGACPSAARSSAAPVRFAGRQRSFASTVPLLATALVIGCSTERASGWDGRRRHGTGHSPGAGQAAQRRLTLSMKVVTDGHDGQPVDMVDLGPWSRARRPLAGTAVAVLESASCQSRF